MKVTVTKKEVTLTSETRDEAEKLMLLAIDSMGEHKEIEKQEVKSAVKKHKKHVFKKTCHVCGQVCIGGTGLATHIRAKHPQNQTPLL